MSSVDDCLASRGTEDVSHFRCGANHISIAGVLASAQQGIGMLPLQLDYFSFFKPRHLSIVQTLDTYRVLSIGSYE